ncbi:GNAT family N-acetyltransferase [Shinella zoogloeoides]|uniref:GNAT family N-acetyltransferase n=1 Tax=Shinella zoogloeoides TaxID=352475 RepID=A0A6N8TJR4_SHIZO|nr:GNAT family N-acetyltransferase [Shinella zoogloeoides]MXO01354.1 GNAT family N-acetyltransferase [Shinella zoogloeoides]UEX81549.1 GNAT family N-acetyltransferase [Shinella zoogloeoides]
MALIIRDAAEHDEAAWRRLWAGYLAFYEAEVSEEVTAFTWARVLDPGSRVSMRVAEEDGKVMGFAIHHYHDSTWDIAPECYLEDLFVDGTARGKGVGRALIDDLIALSKRHGWRGIYWHTRHDNARARKLYDSYVETDGHIRYRLQA